MDPLMMTQEESRPQSTIHTELSKYNREAGCIYALITGKRSVSRRNRASWYLTKLNKAVTCDTCEQNFINADDNQEKGETTEEKEPGIECDDPDITLISLTGVESQPIDDNQLISSTSSQSQKFFLTPSTRVLFLSKSIATSIVLDLSPSVVSVNSQTDCILLDSIFDALKRVLHLLVKHHKIPSFETKSPILKPKVFVSVIAYTPFVVAKNNQVLVQNRRISLANIDQVLVEIWICLSSLCQEVHDLVSSTCLTNFDFDGPQNNSVFTFPQPINGGIIRHPGTVLDDIYELGLFSSSLMPRLSRLSVIVISDGLFASSNNLNAFRIKNIAVSFVHLGTGTTFPDACFGYSPYTDLMKFTAKTTMGVYLSHQELIESSHSLSQSKQIPLVDNPLYKLFSWTLHTDVNQNTLCDTPRVNNSYKFDATESDLIGIDPDHMSKFFCFDQPAYALNQTNTIAGSMQSELTNNNYHDWTSFRQLQRSLDADFEQVLACLLREGYLIKHIRFEHKGATKIVAKLILHWRHNLDLEQELTAPYWSSTDPFELSDGNQLIMRPFKTPLYGETFCEIYAHGSYSFLHNLYCDRRAGKRRSEFRDLAYRQYRQLIDGVLQTHERLQYLSLFYRDSSLSKVPSFLLHGNSLLYEQPHTHRLTSTIENVLDENKTSEFQKYWQKISCLDTKSWKNLMHIHTLRLVLEHDQPKHKNIHCQNANGRYTHVQCRRALSAVSNFIKGYASFALLEDTTYVKFVVNNEDLRDKETSATKGFIVIRINKLLPIIVIYLMFTSGILDSQRAQIVSYLEDQLVNCKLRTTRVSTTTQVDDILKSKTISPSGESCCALMRSPLERMLKVYSRNFIGDFLIHNWSFGLPGSCPYTIPHSTKLPEPGNGERFDTEKDNIENSDTTVSRFNIVFGKYLYGVRVIQTIRNLPHDVVPSLAANVLSKISAILVNVHIKQGFHIAFNNSGILNLVIEVAMQDKSKEKHSSSCLCQYVVFPPVLSNFPQQVTLMQNPYVNDSSSKPASLSGSLANSEGYMRTAQEQVQHMKNDDGEIKMVKEYWIEQQYGVSIDSNNYHKSMIGFRYSEIVDHLFKIDSSLFNSLLTYDLLQLLCDKLSLFHELDSSWSCADSTPICSPTTSANSSSHYESCPIYPRLPSILIDGSSRNGTPRIPLLEFEYKFSVVEFLELCQEASLNVLLFKDRSEFFEQAPSNHDKPEPGFRGLSKLDSVYTSDSMYSSSAKVQCTRKMSVDINESETDHIKREHRSSYQHESNATLNNSYNYINSFYSVSLNHMFLETLQRRLKQMHDKELKLSDQDNRNLPFYLKRRILMSHRINKSESADTSPHPSFVCDDLDDLPNLDDMMQDKTRMHHQDCIDWRCFLRKGNQENLMIVFVPSTIEDIEKWLNFVHSPESSFAPHDPPKRYDPVCPLVIFRCSSTMINDHVLSFLNKTDGQKSKRLLSELDLNLHFGYPCRYMGRLETFNDELDSEISPLSSFGQLNQLNSDDKTLEIVHFRAFLRKIKNTVLKSKFNSLNDAYLSELFVHKDDILYYINNVDVDTQKKYHVSTQLKNLADFIKNYEEFNESQPIEPERPCNQLLNSILLQKCGLFINQPIARFNESNPLLKQLHDKKLLFLMRSNYKIKLPILEENIARSTLLKKFLNPSQSPTLSTQLAANTTSFNASGTQVAFSSSTNESKIFSNLSSSSFSRSEGTRLIEMRHSSSAGINSASPNALFSIDSLRNQQAARFDSNSNLSTSSSYPSDSFILEVFRQPRTCSIKDLPLDEFDMNDISMRHEAHMAEVLRQSYELRESHHYRRVLKSKSSYNQSYSAIDQALKRVDSLGRLEHFCLTPLLFDPSWRSKLAPVRDHTIESENQSSSGAINRLEASEVFAHEQETQRVPDLSDASLYQNDASEEDDQWHQIVCNNYIKEYEQYIQTLGFNSIQMRYLSGSKASSNLQTFSGSNKAQPSNYQQSKIRSKRLTTSNMSPSYHLGNSVKGNQTSPVLVSSPSNISGSSTNNASYLIKFLNSGCLVFKVGFCKPYVYSILYSIEGERFNNSNIKLNMTAFLDELDNIKVTMHLHSFTYDYHLRSIYSYIAGRQLTFSPGYHLISFLDEFVKYYQKAPNYARNHVLCGEICVSDLKVTGQQLYNYIVTHNSAYNMEVLKMSSDVVQELVSNFANHSFMDDHKRESLGLISGKDMNVELTSQTKSHANDYVLIELKREKVRYKDEKDPDIFDCGLLITHDIQGNNTNKNSLNLKYFLLLTNQRDLYPKLIHTYDSVVGHGCHRPIRFGLVELRQGQPKASSTGDTSTGTSSSRDAHELDDAQSCDLQSSGEISGARSTISTVNSIKSSVSGIQSESMEGIIDKHLVAFNQQPVAVVMAQFASANSSTNSGQAMGSQVSSVMAVAQQDIKLKMIESDVESWREDLVDGAKLATPTKLADDRFEDRALEPQAGLEFSKPSATQPSADINIENVGPPTWNASQKRKRHDSSGSHRRNAKILSHAQDGHICDEDITYLGYFSSEEMDMLHFLQEKRDNLCSHIGQVVRLAELHYRRDYLWHKLMQRPVNQSSNKNEEVPLSSDELLQLLAIVEAIDLASLDVQLSLFTGMPLEWHMKLLKAFSELKQSSQNQHRIHLVRAGSRIFLLYVDPKCSSAFILLSIDQERGATQLSLLLKERQQLGINQKTDAIQLESCLPTVLSGEQGPSTILDQEHECQQLINDFINFCATFMWSTLLA